MHSEVLSWTNQDPRDSRLFNGAGLMYRFGTTVSADGQSVTTLYRSLRKAKEERVARLEWSSNGALGRAVIGKNQLSMNDLVRPDPRVPGSRIFTAPDGNVYRWRPTPNTADVALQDSRGNVVAMYRPTRPTRYDNIGDVCGELHFMPDNGSSTIMHPPVMDCVTVTAMLYRFCMAFNL